VPEATVNEHGEPYSTKDDVGPPLETRKDDDVGPISHTTTVKFLPEHDLRTRVSTSIRPHPGLSCG
jgi:hypothetical protein